MASPASDAAFLARNAAEALPAGALERKLEEAAKEGRPLRVKLGLDPTTRRTSTSGTPSCCRSCASSRTSATAWC